jgi:iron(III) transport system ATP-binding protein
MIVGVETPSSGQIFVDEKLISSTSFQVPPEARSIGLMFQDFALFPHLNVQQNVNFGLTGSKDFKRKRSFDLLEKVGLSHLAFHYPHSLSGGEQQRIALIRALAPQPKIMLMDEPFSGLDDRLRDEIRDETFNLLRSEDTAVLMVTHDPQEAMKVADEIALMRNGKILQRGAPYNIYNAPVDLKALQFFSDANAIQATLNGSLADTPFGQFFAPGLPNGTDIDIVFRPQHVRIDFDRNGRGPSPTASQGIAAKGIVKRARFVGNESLIEFEMDFGVSIKASVPNVFLPNTGHPLWLTVPRDKCYIFPK